MSSVKLRLNKNRLLKNGTYPLIVQVIVGRQKKQVSTYYYIRDYEFNVKTEMVLHVPSVNTKKVVKETNKSLSNLKEEISGILEVLENSNAEYTADDFMNFYKSRTDKKDFFYFMSDQIKLKKDLKKTGTAKAYRSTLNSLKKYEKSEFLNYEKIDSLYIEKYIQFLMTEDNCDNTIKFYIRNFRAVYNRNKKERRDEGPNPFKGINTKIEKTHKRSVPKATIAEIDQLDLSAEPLKERARNLFLFSYNTMGMSFIDMMKLTKKNLADDNETLNYYRSKTNQLIQVPLNDRAKEIINLYHTNDSDYLFSFMDTPSVGESFYENYRAELGRTNRQLKKIGEDLELDIELTTYVARHSWAQAANEAGIPVTLISKAFGHTCIQTTIIYLSDFSLATVRQANDCVTCM